MRGSCGGPESVSVRCFAKLNLTLSVGARRPDGYHEIESVMQSVSLHDLVTVRRSEEGISLTCSDPTLPTNEKNTAYRAAAAYRRAAGIDAGVHIHIEKRIPYGAGMGGGSADAAGVLVALEHLFGAGYSEEDLCRLGTEVGADVPFCVAGGVKLATGIGERLTRVPSTLRAGVLILKPEAALSTPEMYAALDREAHRTIPRTGDLLEALGAGDLGKAAVCLQNDFEPVATRVCPEIAEAKRRLLSAGAVGAAMTGSGSAVYSLWPDVSAAEAASRGCSDSLFKTYLCELCGSGVEIL